MKKVAKMLCVALALIMVFTLAGCGNSGDSPADSSTTSSDSGTSGDSSAASSTEKTSSVISEVKKVAEPKASDGTLTKDEMLKKYRPYTDYRIYEIKTATSSIKPKNGGTAYYVSSFNGNDTFDGKSEKTPVKTLAKLNYFDLKAGDVVYFERGSIFRGNYTAKTEGVTYTAYGKGNKPEFYASPINGANENNWEETSTKGVWRFKMPINQNGSDVGAIILDGKQSAIFITVQRNASGNINKATGEKFNGYQDITKDLNFYHAPDNYVYMRCNKGNPGKIYKSIEFNVHKHIFRVEARNITVDNLCFKYTGAHGVSGGSNDGLTVQNCQFEWIGGSILGESFGGRNYPTRFGNAVEIYGAAKNLTVKNCYFNQIYDTAVTFQVGSDVAGDMINQNIKMVNNVVEYCEWPFEYFVGQRSGTTRYIKDVSVDNNLMWYTGYGLCESRPDTRQDACIKGWESSANHCLGNFTITNNLFALAKTQLVQACATPGNERPTFSGNTYIQGSNRMLGYTGDMRKAVRFTLDTKANIESMLGDKKAVIVTVKE